MMIKNFPGKRTCARGFFIPLLVFAFLLSLPLSGFAQDPKAPDKAQEESSASTTADTKVSIPVAEGQDVIGLRIPHFNENGELILQISAETARRLDDDNVEMETMRVEFFDEDRERMEIVVAKSQFNMESRILTSDTPATISRRDFTIEGDTLEFDLAEQVGKMQGSVKMTIHSTESNDQ